MPRYINSVAVMAVMELLDDNPDDVNDAVASAVTSIQTIMIISQFPAGLCRHMNGWAIYNGWYHIDGVPKFVHCLRKIVMRELKRRVFDYLTEDMTDSDPLPDEEDLRSALRIVSSVLSNGNWSTMDNHTMISELCVAVYRWIKNHKEQMPEDVSNTFQWFDHETGELCYHLPHLPKPVVINAAPVLSSLETLPCEFQHEKDWTCPICLNVDAQLECVRTACAHVFHKKCLNSAKNVFLMQAENVGKTCPCPLCRANIN